MALMIFLFWLLQIIPVNHSVAIILESETPVVHTHISGITGAGWLSQERVVA
jgi:hypothetical protein